MGVLNAETQPQHRQDIEQPRAQQGDDGEQEEQVGDRLPGINKALHTGDHSGPQNAEVTPMSVPSTIPRAVAPRETVSDTRVP